MRPSGSASEACSQVVNPVGHQDACRALIQMKQMPRSIARKEASSRRDEWEPRITVCAVMKMNGGIQLSVAPADTGSVEANRSASLKMRHCAAQTLLSIGALNEQTRCSSHFRLSDVCWLGRLCAGRDVQGRDVARRDVARCDV